MRTVSKNEPHASRLQTASLHSGGNNRGAANVLFGNRFDLRFGQRREISRLGGDNSLKRLRMTRLQILTQEIDRAALTRCVPDEDDR